MRLREVCPTKEPCTIILKKAQVRKTKSISLGHFTYQSPKSMYESNKKEIVEGHREENNWFRRFLLINDKGTPINQTQ